MNWPFGELKMFGYDVVVADPPWQFERWSDKNQKKGAADQYDLMSLDEIKAVPAGQLAKGDALLLLWTCGWAMATGAALEVVRAWGATPVTELVWIKTTRNGKVRMGTGYRARTMHEPILLAKWGNPQHKAFPSSFTGIARRHSEKPVEFYKMVVEHTLGAWRCDLFSAGIHRPGFEGCGSDHRSGQNQAKGAKDGTRETPQSQQSSFL